MTATAKLFMHGRSQAVRLPKEFRFEGSEVRVSKVGDKVILEPMRKPPIDPEKIWAKIDALGGRDFLPDGVPDDPPLLLVEVEPVLVGQHGGPAGAEGDERRPERPGHRERPHRPTDFEPRRGRDLRPCL